SWASFLRSCEWHSAAPPCFQRCPPRRLAHQPSHVSDQLFHCDAVAVFIKDNAASVECYIGLPFFLPSTNALGFSRRTLAARGSSTSCVMPVDCPVVSFSEPTVVTSFTRMAPSGNLPSRRYA